MARKIVGILVVIAIMMASSLTVYAAPTGGAGAVSDNTVKSVPEGNTEKDSDKNIDKNIDKKTDKNTDKNSTKTAEPDFKAILDSVIKDGKAINTDQILFTITIKNYDPEKVLTSTSKSFSITGTTEQKDVKMFLAKYNEKTMEYEDFANTDGESSWDIGSRFSTTIILKEGQDQNKIKIVAYKTSQEKDLKLEDVQVNCFTISYLPESKLKNDKIDLVKSVEKKLENIFPKK